MKTKTLIDRMRAAMMTGLVLGAAAAFSTAAAGVIEGVNVDFNSGAGTYHGQGVLKALGN